MTTTSALTASAKAESIEVTASKIEFFNLASSDNTAGKMSFVGGLDLTSENENFGGLSGLRFNSDGSRLYSVSDNGFWFTGEIARNESGQILSLTGAELTCLCQTNGQPYSSKHWADAEGLEIAGNRAFVVFERLNRINVYNMDGAHKIGPPSQANASLKPYNIAYNTGLEAMAIAPPASPISGKFIAIAEESLNAEGNNRAFIADKKNVSELALVRSDNYSVTDATFMANGDLLVLERRFGLAIGIGIRIKRVNAHLIKPGKTIDGEVLLEAGLSSRIDNMEGITTWQTANGEIRIAILSDDNYNKRLQRTLLLEFKLND
ncbi:MAG: esterase-like activity of phytase family protein [Salaquimonas sp.]